MNVFGDDGSVKPDESNIIDMRTLLDLIKKEISDYVNEEIKRFKKETNE